MGNVLRRRRLITMITKGTKTTKALVYPLRRNFVRFGSFVNFVTGPRLTVRV
jgi:hypothetical protein